MSSSRSTSTPPPPTRSIQSAAPPTPHKRSKLDFDHKTIPPLPQLLTSSIESPRAPYEVDREQREVEKVEQTTVTSRATSTIAYIRRLLKNGAIRALSVVLAGDCVERGFQQVGLWPVDPLLILRKLKPAEKPTTHHTRSQPSTAGMIEHTEEKIKETEEWEDLKKRKKKLSPIKKIGKIRKKDFVILYDDNEEKTSGAPEANPEEQSLDNNTLFKKAFEDSEESALIGSALPPFDEEASFSITHSETDGEISY